MENAETPPEENVLVEDDVAKKLADEVIKNTNGNGNGNGHHAKEAGGFSLFDDLEKETQQDKYEEEKKKTGAADPAGGKKNPFTEYDPERDDVKEEELRDTEKITLEEANARVALYLAGVDFAVSQACCIIRNDFSVTSQLKYRIHDWRKKAIQIPWVRFVMLPKKRSNPAWALMGAIFIGVCPILGMAAVDRMHDNRMQEDPAYAEKVNAEKNNTKRRPDPRPGFKTEKDIYDPDYAEDVDYVEVKDNRGSSNYTPPPPPPPPAKSKVGRHAKSCPKHLDSESKEACNCK